MPVYKYTLEILCGSRRLVFLLSTAISIFKMTGGIDLYPVISCVFDKNRAMPGESWFFRKMF